MDPICRRAFNLISLYFRRATLGQLRRALVLDIGAHTRGAGVPIGSLAKGYRQVILIFLRLREYWLRVSLDLPYCFLRLFSSSDLSRYGQQGVKAVTLRWEERLSLDSDSDKFFGLTSSTDLRYLELQAFYPKLVYIGNWRFNLKTLIIHEPLSIDRLQYLFIESNSVLQNLEELEFGVTCILDDVEEDDDLDWPDELPQITLGNLRSLTYRFDNCQIGSIVIAAFYTPLLTTFIVNGHDASTSSKWRRRIRRSIGGMLENSGCHLQVLKLDGPPFANIGFEDWAEIGHGIEQPRHGRKLIRRI